MTYTLLPSLLYKSSYVIVKPSASSDWTDEYIIESQRPVGLQNGG